MTSVTSQNDHQNITELPPSGEAMRSHEEVMGFPPSEEAGQSYKEYSKKDHDTCQHLHPFPLDIVVFLIDYFDLDPDDSSLSTSVDEETFSGENARNEIAGQFLEYFKE